MGDERTAEEINEEVRREQLRADGRRPMAVDLAEAIALSDELQQLAQAGRAAKAAAEAQR